MASRTLRLTSGGTWRARSSLFLSGIHSIEDFLIATIACHGNGAGGVGPDTTLRIGSELEQQIRQFEVAPQHSHVHCPHLAASQTDNLRTPRDQFAGGPDIAAFHRRMQLFFGDSVDSGLQLRPALKSIGSRSTNCASCKAKVSGEAPR
jgi:hypothetical protein